jgi:predicted amidohydrolase
MKKFRVCGVQVETGENPAENRKKIYSLMGEASCLKPDFILFPEMFEVVVPPLEAIKFSHPVPSELTDEIGELARKYSVNIIAGTFFERDGDSVFNTAVVFDREGRICGTYRKMHLFDAFGYDESKGIKPGHTPLLVEIDGLRFGVAICYDVRFPEIFRHYALGGAQVVFVPSAFFQPNHDHWQLNIRSRALDNTIFAMGCNQTGRRFVGRSMVANPWGITVASMGVEEGFFSADLDVDLIEDTRKKLPFLENRRFDVVIRNKY